MCGIDFFNAGYLTAARDLIALALPERGEKHRLRIEHKSEKPQEPVVNDKISTNKEADNHE